MTEPTTDQCIELESAVNETAEFKQLKDMADSKYKESKSNLESLCAEFDIHSIVTTEFEMKITESRRFKAYSDDETVLRLIPIQHLKECTSLNKKKIDGLIKKGVLPKSIKDEEKFTRITTTKFTKVE